MSDTMPERVWLDPVVRLTEDDGGWWYFESAEQGEPCYVPEQRALDAEETLRRLYSEGGVTSTVYPELYRLRADLKARDELLREVLNDCDAILPHSDSRVRYIEPQIARVTVDEIRAILDREGV